MKPWLKFKKKKKKKRKEKRKEKIISFHLVTGSLASLSIECLCKKMKNLIWLIVWLV